MKTAVIVTTYNRPDALAAVLDGYLAQRLAPDELIVADDGSKPDTGEVVADYVTRAAFPVRHVWQEDLGFRAAAARNRALAATQADYIIFTDGDCVPAHDFVARHAALAQPGFFLSGNRVLLTEAYTREVLAQHLPLHALTPMGLLRARLRGDINRVLTQIRLPDGGWRRAAPDRWKGVKTCNFSAWRADLLRVNGLDESYSGWGMEDSDLVIRLLHAGIKHKSARFATFVFHLWHRENDRSRLEENQRALRTVMTSGRVQAQLGVAQYL